MRGPMVNVESVVCAFAPAAMSTNATSSESLRHMCSSAEPALQVGCHREGVALPWTGSSWTGNFIAATRQGARPGAVPNRATSSRLRQATRAYARPPLEANLPDGGPWSGGGLRVFAGDRMNKPEKEMALMSTASSANGILASRGIRLFFAWLGFVLLGFGAGIPASAGSLASREICASADTISFSVEHQKSIRMCRSIPIHGSLCNRSEERPTVLGKVVIRSGSLCVMKDISVWKELPASK